MEEMNPVLPPQKEEKKPAVRKVDYKAKKKSRLHRKRVKTQKKHSKA